MDGEALKAPLGVLQQMECRERGRGSKTARRLLACSTGRKGLVENGGGSGTGVGARESGISFGRGV